MPGKNRTLTTEYGGELIENEGIVLGDKTLSNWRTDEAYKIPSKEDRLRILGKLREELPRSSDRITEQFRDRCCYSLCCRC